MVKFKLWQMNRESPDCVRPLAFGETRHLAGYEHS